jgi:hypothetical protein
LAEESRPQDEQRVSKNASIGCDLQPGGDCSAGADSLAVEGLAQHPRAWGMDSD